MTGTQVNPTRIEYKTAGVWGANEQLDTTDIRWSWDSLPTGTYIRVNHVYANGSNHPLAAESLSGNYQAVLPRDIGEVFLFRQ